MIYRTQFKRPVAGHFVRFVDATSLAEAADIASRIWTEGTLEAVERHRLAHDGQVFTERDAPPRHA